jgi:hypothetical protein
MPAIAFDTHKFIRVLKESDNPGNQEETLVEVIWVSRSDVDVIVKEAVTLHDGNLWNALHETERRLESRIADTKSNLIRWVVGAGLLQIALLAGVLLKVAKLV